eukprot:scaffold214_cov249-Pinguiococcus_pyrenoidosus.AAC.26
MLLAIARARIDRGIQTGLPIRRREREILHRDPLRFRRRALGRDSLEEVSPVTRDLAWSRTLVRALPAPLRRPSPCKTPSSHLSALFVLCVLAAKSEMHGTKYRGSMYKSYLSIVSCWYSIVALVCVVCVVCFGGKKRDARNEVPG